MYRMVPLPGTFMITGILGLMVVIPFTVSGKISPSWGVAFSIIFGMMFIASMASITPSGASGVDDLGEDEAKAEQPVKKTRRKR